MSLSCFPLWTARAQFLQGPFEDSKMHLKQPLKLEVGGQDMAPAPKHLLQDPCYLGKIQREAKGQKHFLSAHCGPSPGQGVFTCILLIFKNNPLRDV